jgi:hypothetical protein
VNRDIRITLKDAGTPTTLVVSGHLPQSAMDNFVAQSRKVMMAYDRDGVHSRRLETQVQHSTLKFSTFRDAGFADAAATSLHNWVNETGPYSGLTRVDSNSDAPIWAALVEFLDKDGNVDESVALSHVHFEPYGIGGNDFLTTDWELVSTGTEVWAS